MRKVRQAGRSTNVTMAMVFSGAILCTGGLSLAWPHLHHHVPQFVAVVLDSSASFDAHRKDAANSVMAMLEDLEDGSDQISIYRMSEDVQTLYRGRPSPMAIRQVMDAYTSVHPVERGTAYGEGLQMAFDEACAYSGHHPEAHCQVFVMGDGADEPCKANLNLTDLDLPQVISKPEPAIHFMFLDPQWHLQQKMQEALRGTPGADCCTFTTAAGVSNQSISDYLN
jgi:hypothetical protein